MKKILFIKKFIKKEEDILWKKTIFIFLSLIIMVFIINYFEIENNFVNIICGLCIGLLSRRIN